MSRSLLTASCALVPALSMAAAPVTPHFGGRCPAVPAECRVNPPVFNFGRAEMTHASPPVHAHAIIAVTCTKGHGDGYEVDVEFELKGLPPAPHREMRDRIGGADLRFDLFVDPARRRYWGDGESHGTFTFRGAFSLNDRHRVATAAFPVYGRVDGGQVVPSGPFLGAVLSRVEYTLRCR